MLLTVPPLLLSSVGLQDASKTPAVMALAFNSSSAIECKFHADVQCQSPPVRQLAGALEGAHDSIRCKDNLGFLNTISIHVRQVVGAVEGASK